MDITKVARAVRLVKQYLARKCTRAETHEMIELLTEERIGTGTKVVFHYKITVGTDTFERKYAAVCPRCGKHTVYLFSDFGPGCSGMEGGCGYKVPNERRPWYVEPYVHKDDAKK